MSALMSAGFFSSIDYQGKAVDEQDDVGTPHLLAVHGELLHREQVILAVEVDHPRTRSTVRRPSSSIRSTGTPLRSQS
jgi:hypothetical protein